MKKFYLAVATGLGFGLMSPASGTWGTLVGIPLVLIFSHVSHFWYFVAMALLFALGVKAASEAERHYGEADDGRIVIDEIVGYMVTMWPFPAHGWNMFWAFILFRIFDVIKPFPARRIDEAKAGGLGVMADDVFAAIWALAALWILCRLGWFGCRLK
jgi:phosphatidylglycerophosphatase A